MKNIRISYDLKPAHTPEYAEKLASIVITHTRSFTPSPDWISAVFSEFDREGYEILDLPSIKLAIANAVIQLDASLLFGVLDIKKGTVGDFIALLIDASGRIPDDLVLERLKSAGIRWVKFGGEIYLSDRLTENELSNLILDRFGDSRCDQK